MASETAARLTAALADRYTLERELGAGGMATVYLAHDIKHDRKVAVKVLRPELAAVIGAERFLAEIKTTANLQHPNILPLFYSGAVVFPHPARSEGPQSFLFYVMPFIDGVSLRDRITREHQLPVDDAVRIAREVAAALDYAHRHGVIHRDIKPENILLHDGSALVADFGIALAVSTAGTRMTETGMSLGTPHYMSPEQAMGEREITARSDVYALGCITYEMLVGEPPFTGPTAQAIIARVMTEEPRQLGTQRKSIPPQVEDAVLHALEKLPADRFATAAQFAEALAGQGPTLATRATASAAARSAGGAGWRRRFQVASAVAVVALGLAGWGWMHGRTGEQPVERRYLSLGDSVQLQAPSNNGDPLGLSPDGSVLAFLGDSLSRIWIKRRDRLEPVLLPGTEHAGSPTFSPDGQWIAYVADGHLKKVKVDGGGSVTIADSAAISYGIAWLDDNTIVFTNTRLLGLRRVSAAGGALTVALEDSVFKGLAPFLPTPLPNARGVLVQVCASDCVTSALWAIDFKSGRQKLVLNDVGGGWYLPTGQLLFLRRDGVVMAAPFSLSKLAVTGASVPVLQGVVQVRLLTQLAWSRSGTMVYGAGGVASDVVSVQQADRTGAESTFDRSWSGEFNSFAVSPDAKRVAVGVTTPGTGLDIWVKQLASGPFTRLTFSGRDRRPAWSPDGREIAFIRDSSSGGDVYVREADGTGSDRRMVHLDRAAQEVVWSHDGRWLLVRTETGAVGTGDILAVRASGDTGVVGVATTPFTELQPALSPDDRWVAFVSNENGTNEIYVRPFPNSNAGHWQVSNGGGGSPAWSADGRELFYLDPNNRMMAAEVVPGANFTVSSRTPLFDATGFTYIGYHQVFDVTKDGHFVHFGLVGPAARTATKLVEVDNWFADIRARLKP